MSNKQFEIYQIAKKEEGVHEFSPGSNPKIVEYHSCTSLKAPDDNIPWCSSFANWCCAQAGIKGTNSAAALSWLHWGEEVNNPQVGDFVVMKRGESKSQGHIAFFESKNKSNGLPMIKVFGGNQGDKVCSEWMREDHVIGYRRIRK